MIQVRFALRDTEICETKLNAFVPAKKIVTGELIDEWFLVVGTDGPHTAIKLQIKFTPCEINPIYSSGISENFAVERSYFPMRHGGKLTLYQDAHVIDGMLPEIKLEDGRNFEHEKCWEDICHSISEALHLVYIVGWSVYHKVKLVREPSKQLPNGGDLNLGELLKYKAQQGVRVALLVWNDRTSCDNCFIKTVRTVYELLHCCSVYML
ncbi:PREDICTED: phospholipase D delta-like [Erythranthe guttata]|uniref:phospholipase D delta-like n=1 Tax=Erythranthe guttata TaxID=4155 RepID=UPI00064DDAE8|nr:PREDICTED: phospholipase D delta-like [Erythranthe guttata]|eukprot:XP_012833055.1 PREDICTED: phospholipase D delta-like [Erythranthe guttata]